MALCLSVCLSVYHKSEFYRIGLNGSSSFLAYWLLSTYLILNYKEIQMSPKIRVLPSGTFPKLWT